MKTFEKQPNEKQSKKIFEKQKEIDDLLESFINTLPYEDEDGQSRDENGIRETIKDVARNVCRTIDKVLDDDYFLPRYYTLSHRLIEKEKDRQETFGVSSRVKNLITESINFLSELDLESPETKTDPGLRKYCEDKEFKHYVNEFYTSALHEVIIYEASTMSNKFIDNLSTVQSGIAVLDDNMEAFGTTAVKVNELEDKVENLNTDVQKKLDEADVVLKKANISLQEAKAMQEETKNMLPNLLTILGIFVAIIIAIVGVYLSIILNDHSNSLISALFVVDSIWARIIFVLLLGIFVFDMLFVFLFWIAKISGRSVACSCIHGVCENCKKGKICNSFVRVFKKYWNFIVFNTVIFLFMATCMGLHWNNLNEEQKTQFITNEYTVSEATPAPDTVWQTDYDAQ